MIDAAPVVRRFLVSTRAVAAVEFALLIPMMLVLLLASIDAGRAMAIYVKVRSATYTLGGRRLLRDVRGAYDFSEQCVHRVGDALGDRHLEIQPGRGA